MLRCIWKATCESCFALILEMLRISVNIKHHGIICMNVTLALTQVVWSKSGTRNESLTKLGRSIAAWMPVGERNIGCKKSRV